VRHVPHNNWIRRMGRGGREHQNGGPPLVFSHFAWMHRLPGCGYNGLALWILEMWEAMGSLVYTT
jgi:hypothetical protein